MIIVDLETGGLNPKKDGICSITMKVFNKDKIKTWFVKPCSNKSYSKQALQVNGLSLDKLDEIGQEPLEVIAEIKDFLMEYKFYHQTLKPKLLGQNLAFDINFLEEFFNEYDLNHKSFKKLVHYHYKDTMILAEFFKESKCFNFDSLRLCEIYKYFYGEDDCYKDAHTSQSDVIMCERVYNKFLESIKG